MPTREFLRMVKPADVTIGASATGTIEFPHPANDVTAFTTVPSTKRTLGIQEDAAGLTPINSISFQDGIYDGVFDLTQSEVKELGFLAGVVTVRLDSTLGVAATIVRRVQIVDISGNVVFTIFQDDADGIPSNDAQIAALLSNVPVDHNQGIRLTLFNSAGGPVTGSGLGRYHLGINHLPEPTGLD